MQDQHVWCSDAIDDHVLSHGKTPKTRPKIMVSGTPDFRIAGNQEESVSKGVD